MQKKYKTALCSILIAICIMILFGIGYMNYEKPIIEEDNAVVHVDGNLSFNFIDGNFISTEEEIKEYQFSVTNTSNDSYFYNISLEKVLSGENASFEIISSREGFQKIENSYPSNDSKIASSIKINANETHSYTFFIKNPSKNKIEGKIVVALEKEMASFANVILKNNVVNANPKTAPAIDLATEEEGLIETTDSEGTSYYFRGKINNNYVVFANKSWRIVKINGDGTVKLILNDLINNNTQYYANNNDYDLDFKNSKILDSLNLWYESNLKDYDNFIANHKFCTDATEDSGNYTPLTRLYTNHSPIFECLGTTTTSKIGLLTADEVALAGANNKSQNHDFYLYNANIGAGWWTMSPAKNQNGIYSFIEIYSNGQMSNGTTGTLFRGNRPTINLIKKVNVSGIGTPEDPYIVNNL